MYRWPSFLLAISLLASAASADEKLNLPPLNVDKDAGQNCVDVEIGGSKTYDCLNEKMKRDSNRLGPLPTPPIDAKSSDIKKGIVNVPAVRQQYGPNFGKSVVPYRPEIPTYTPLHR